MKKSLFLLFAACIYQSSLSAQFLSAGESDPEAIQLMTKAGQAFGTKNAQVNFKLKVTSPGMAPQITDGVLYQSGTSYHLDLSDYAIFSDGKTRWVYLKGPKEINIYSESNGQDWISPQDFLQLHKATDLVFIVAGIKSNTTIIEAKPLKGGRFEDYSKFTIGISDGMLNFIYGISSDGMRQEMNISAVTFPSTLDTQKLFTFQKDKYPGAHIEDLRLD